VVAWISGGSIVRLGESTASVQTSYVTHDYFSALRATPVEGRFFLPEEEDYVQPRAVAIVSTRLVERLVGDGPQVVGRSLAVDDVVFTIVGVSAPTVHFAVDVWMPMPSINLMHEGWDFDDARGSFSSDLLARLAPAATRAQATAELDALSRQFRESIGQASAGFLLHGTRPIDDPGT